MTAPIIGGMGRGQADDAGDQTASARTRDATRPDPYDERFDALFDFAEHDYDPRWDYELRLDQLDHPLYKLAQQATAELAAREDTPFDRAHVFPADLSAAANPSGVDAVGVYCAGTYTEPVILIDIDAHWTADVISPEAEISRTTEHELMHAIQEWRGEGASDWADEDEAERGLSAS